MLKYIILLMFLIIGFGFFGSNRKHKWFYIDNYFYATCIPMFIIFCLIIGVSFEMANRTIDLNSIDEQISIIEEQNAKIDKEVKNSVLFYMEYESDTYDALKQDLDSVDLVVLTQQFPELKSNELVTTNINVYVKNENKLTKLKLSKAKKQAFVDFWW